MKFRLESDYKPTGDQPQAITRLVNNLTNGLSDQVLLGVTGSGKTFTIAHAIARLQKPALIISHNKTLAAQLYQEFKSFFPKNAVSYFVSYYDYYQPEAYIPTTDTYIDKETEINEEIDKLRLEATMNLLTRPDTIVVASVSCIYNIGSPTEYGKWILELRPGMKIDRDAIFKRLTELHYERSEYGFHRGSFRVRGESIDIFPAYDDTAIRLIITDQKISAIQRIHVVSGKMLESIRHAFAIYPAKHYLADPLKEKETFKTIRRDLAQRIQYFKKHGKHIEAQRIEQRVTYDLEMMEQMGYVNGIENYSRYFDGRNPNDPPFTLLDYYKDQFGSDWLLVIDESHMTIPQIRGMYHGDRSRKETLIDYGFRLPASLDNRPLRFEEFLDDIPQTIYVSATPEEWEIQRVKSQKSKVKSYNQTGIVEQLIRPTGLVDPAISVRPVTNQIPDLITEIEKRVARKERVLVTTLTKRMAEDLTAYLSDKSINVQYIHSDIATIERSDILMNLRSGQYDVVVGINLLREGLDLPEVSLVAILDADKEGFLRSRTALIQTMGRAARHVAGEVILYADTTTKSMKRAIDEVKRRRAIQLSYNKEHNITPVGISKPIRARIVEEAVERPLYDQKKMPKKGIAQFDHIADDTLTPMDRKKMIQQLKRQMRLYAKDLDFEAAARIRDRIHQLQQTV